MQSLVKVTETHPDGSQREHELTWQMNRAIDYWDPFADYGQPAGFVAALLNTYDSHD